MGNFNWRQLLALLMIYTHNVHVLHWNVTGLDFDPTHAKLDEYYEEMNSYVDDIAEMGLELGIRPVGYTEAIDVLDDPEVHYLLLRGSETFKSHDAWEAIRNMFIQLVDFYESMTKQSDLPGDVVNKLQEHQQWFRKQVSYKNRQRLL